MFPGVRGEELGNGNELREYNRENNKSPRIFHLKDIKTADKGEEKEKTKECERERTHGHLHPIIWREEINRASFLFRMIVMSYNNAAFFLPCSLLLM